MAFLNYWVFNFLLYDKKNLIFLKLSYPLIRYIREGGGIY